MSKDDQKKPESSPKTGEAKKAASVATKKDDEKQATAKQEVVAAKDVSDKKAESAKQADNIKAKNVKNTENVKTPPLSKENAPTKKSPVASKKEPKNRSLSVFLWPVLCSALTAGGLIGTKDMWMGSTSLTATTPAVFEQSKEILESQQKEIATLQEQIRLLTERLDEQKDEVKEVVVETTTDESEPEDATADEAVENHMEEAEETGGTDNMGSEETETIVEEPTEEAVEAENTESLEAEIEVSDVQEVVEENSETPELQEEQPVEEEATFALEELENKAVENLQAIEEQKQKIADLEIQLTNLSQTVSELVMSEALETFDRRIGDGEERIAKLESLIAQFEEEIVALKAQLAEMQDVSPVAVVATQYMALDNLASRIPLGENYKDALDAFEAISQTTNETLRAHEQGITPLHRLIAEFKPVSRNILSEERKARAKEEGSQKKKLLSSFNDLVSVSRTDGGAEGSVDRLIYDMEKALKDGNVSGALALLATTAPETQKVAEGWRIKAEEYQLVMSSLSALRESLAVEPDLSNKAGE